MDAGIRIVWLWLMVMGGFAMGDARQARAQDTPSDTTVIWQSDWAGKLSASQAGYHNWQEGGINTLAFTVSTTGKVARTEGAWEQTHEARLAFGLIKQDTLDVRKADDVIRLTSSLQYTGVGFFRTFNPTLGASARTQFAEGYNYDTDPFEEGQTPPVKVSDFLAPGTFTQAVGLTYEPAAWVKQRVGLGAKETVVVIERLRPLYGVRVDQPVRFEAGLEARTEVDKEVLENVRLQSTLGLFASFNQPNHPDVLWENLVTMQVNSYLSVTFEFVTLFDRDISTQAQFKEVLSLGVSFVFL